MFASDEEAQAAWMAHKAKQNRVERLRSAGFPLRAIEGIPNMTGPGLIAAVNLVPRFERGGIVCLIGDRGPGKTQIATWLAGERINTGKPAGAYRKALDLWSEIRATWRTGADKSEDEVIRRYRREPFLTIDEAQERGDTEADRQWCDRIFAHIIDHRYDAMLPTLIVANLGLDGYEKTIPTSIQSRISECGGVKLCNWPSYRGAH